jgi:DNA modification methylase
VIIHADVLKGLATLPDESVHCCVTSPPYWGLRDYGVDGQLGLEKTPQEYITRMVEVFREVRRVLRKDGTCWLNVGDSYWGGKGSNGSSKARRTADERGYLQSGGTVLMDTRPSDGKHESIKPKDLCLIPFRLAIALQEDGWWVRSDIIWAKPNPMPESVTDRPTKSHEYMFLLTKSAKYYFDAEAIKENSVYPDDDRKARSNGEQKRTPTEQIAGVRQGSATYPKRNIRSVWTIPTQPTPEAHFATFPEALIVPCIKAGTSEKGCCPECGSPWERVINVKKAPDDVYTNTKKPVDGFVSVNCTGKGQGQKYQNWRNDNPPETLGWQPTCKCEIETTTPCVCLDPFFGSGTTGIVAKKLQREYIGIELNEEYIKIAERRIEKECGGLF